MEAAAQPGGRQFKNVGGESSLITRKLMIAVFALLLSAGSSGQERDPTVAELAKSARSMLAHRCEVQKMSQERVSSADDKAALQGALDMICTCMLAETDLIETRLTKEGQRSPAEFATQLQASMARCAAEGVRRSTSQSCRSDARDGVPPEYKEEYCKCVEGGLKDLTDSEIASAAITAHANFRAQVAARVQGKPDPAPEAEAISDLSSKCRVRK